MKCRSSSSVSMSFIDKDVSTNSPFRKMSVKNVCTSHEFIIFQER